MFKSDSTSINDGDISSSNLEMKDAIAHAFTPIGINDETDDGSSIDDTIQRDLEAPHANPILIDNHALLHWNSRFFPFSSLFSIYHQ